MMPNRDDDLLDDCFNDNDDSFSDNGGNGGKFDETSSTLGGGDDGRSRGRSGGGGGGLSKAEIRKNKKPIMEKKRRARINQCLNELKSLILEAMKKDPARHTKLEKADILEMTVKHLQTVQRQQLAIAVSTDPAVLQKFKTGFADCAEEVNRYVGQIDNVELGVRHRLANHLSSCITNMQQPLPSAFAFTSSIAADSCTSNSGQPPPQSSLSSLSLSSLSHQQSLVLPQLTPHTSQPTQSFDLNNNSGRIQMGGMQLIPSRLATGELAFVMPNSSNMPFFQATAAAVATAAGNLAQTAATPLDVVQVGRLSAFNAVSKVGRSLQLLQPTLCTVDSPLPSPVSSISSSGDESQHSSVEMFSIREDPPEIVSNLQQHQHVSSSSEAIVGALKVKPFAVITNIPARQFGDLVVGKKRPFLLMSGTSSSTGEELPLPKLGRVIEVQQQQQQQQQQQRQTPPPPLPSPHRPVADDEKPPLNPVDGDMWRPW